MTLLLAQPLMAGNCEIDFCDNLSSVELQQSNCCDAQGSADVSAQAGSSRAVFPAAYPARISCCDLSSLHLTPPLRSNVIAAQMRVMAVLMALSFQSA